MANITVTTSGGATSLVSIGSRGPAGPAGPAGAGGGGSTPAGSILGQVQLRNSDGTALAADSGLVYTGTGNTGVLKVGGGSVIMSDPTVSQNVAIGGGNPTLPLANRTTGNYNTVIGTNSLPTLTSGSGNVAIGTSTLSALLNGNNNVGIGVNTLTAVTSGSGNAAFGNGAGAYITTGNDNICIGGNPSGITNISSISIGATGDGSSTTVIGVGGNSPNTQTRLVGNTLILGHAVTTTSRTSIVQNASESAKTITLPNATGTVPVYNGAAASGKVLTSSGTDGAATWADPTAASVTGTAPIVVTSGVVSLATTLPSAYAFSSTTRPTSSGTGTPAATSLITRDDGDVRFIQKTITSLPTANYTSSSGQNQAWITESWIIPAQTNGLANSNSLAGYAVNGLFVIHASGLGKSLQIFPALTIGVSTAIAGAITDGGVFNSTFCFNVGAGSVDLLANVVSSRMKLSSSGVSSRHLRYRFSTNFAANAGDVIVMNTTGHTFVVDTTVTDATVFTNASTGGVTVRATTGGSAPTTADTSLTVNGGAPITTTYQINSASNTGVHPAAILFASSTGIHLLGTTISSNGTYKLTGFY